MEKNIYKIQNTLRLSNDELDFIDENYEEIAGTADKIPIAKFFIKAVTNSVSIIKSKVVEVSKKEDIEEIQNLKNDIEKLTDLKNLCFAENEKLKQEIQNLKNTAVSKNALVLNLEPKWRKYIWGVLQVSKKAKFVHSYEELIQSLFTVVNNRGELVLNEDDYTYLDTLQYDLKDE